VITLVAIDPGPTNSSVCCFRDGRPLGFESYSNHQLLWHFWNNSFNPNDCQILMEMIACYGMPVGKEVFETCVWIGQFKEACRLLKIPFTYMYRQDAKLHLCKTKRAKDSNIIQALKDRFGDGSKTGKGTKKKPGLLYGIKADEWQALALAVTYSDINKMS
jgi:hypothetical protein